MLEFALFQVDDNQQLSISPVIEEWAKLAEYRRAKPSTAPDE
jgi:hypothetical protein